MSLHPALHPLSILYTVAELYVSYPHLFNYLKYVLHLFQTSRDITTSGHAIKNIKKETKVMIEDNLTRSKNVYIQIGRPSPPLQRFPFPIPNSSEG